MTTAVAQTIVPVDVTPIYRRSFTARYAEIGDFAVREAALSPDGRLVGYVRDNDLYIKELATGTVARITTDGERNRIINGATDWVYEEEYGFTRAWEFSPDSQSVAFLRFDESDVREFTMMRFGGRLYPEPYTFKYPKAGERNSVVTIWISGVLGNDLRQIDTGPETDQYIPRIGWTPLSKDTKKGAAKSGGDLFFYRVNRLQNRFEVVLADKNHDFAPPTAPPSGAAQELQSNSKNAAENPKIPTRTIYTETSPTYVERPDDQTVKFLDADRFTVRSETKTGWWRTYLHTISRGPTGKTVPSPDDANPDDAQKTFEKLTKSPSQDGREYFSFEIMAKNPETGSPKPADVVQNLRRPTPPPGGAAELQSNSKTALPNPLKLYGWMLKPANFDETGARKYPVLLTQYSGPGSQSVFVPTIHEGDMAIYKPLTDAGYVVVCVDGRGTGGRGEEFKKCTYGQLGRLETEDQIAAAKYIASQPWADPERIGIYGWSFGGFTALNCILKGADVFSLAVAVAPVTSWRFYDSIYTEIYNGLPAENPAGYDDNSPLNFAADLRGKLLLVHGTGDDNVHIQNSYEMARALVVAGKRFDMMTYADDNHSMRPFGPVHVRQKIVDYVKANL